MNGQNLIHQAAVNEVKRLLDIAYDADLGAEVFLQAMETARIVLRTRNNSPYLDTIEILEQTLRDFDLQC